MKTCELTGLALDWAVATANGDTFTLAHEDWDWYSSSWEYGGPIIEREKIAVRAHDHDVQEWSAQPSINTVQTRLSAFRTGPTPLIAAMRCFVASKFGDDIEIPKELA